VNNPFSSSQDNSNTNDSIFTNVHEQFPHFKPSPRSLLEINREYFQNHFYPSSSSNDNVFHYSINEFIPSSHFSGQFSDSSSTSHSFGSSTLPHPTQFNTHSAYSSPNSSACSTKSSPHSFHSPSHSSYSSDSPIHSAFIAGVAESAKLPPLLPFPKKVVPPFFLKPLSHSDSVIRIKNRFQLLKKIKDSVPNTPVIPIGSRLGCSVFLKRWSSIKAYALVKKGIIPIYINRRRALSFWKKNKRDYKFKGNKK
jgi:hypothetical protein